MTGASWCVTQGVISELALWHLRFSHQGVRVLTCFGTWCCVIENTPNILKEHGAFIFKVQAIQEELLESIISQKTWKLPLPENLPPHTKIQVMKFWAIQQIDFQFQEPTGAAAFTTNPTNSTTDTNTEHAPWYKRAIAALKRVFTIFGNNELRKRLLICYFSWCVTAMTYYALALNAVNFTADR